MPADLQSALVDRLSTLASRVARGLHPLSHLSFVQTSLVIITQRTTRKAGEGDRTLDNWFGKPTLYH